MRNSRAGMWKKLVFALCFCGELFAFSTAEKDFYSDVNFWKLNGYVTSLPLLKPYSAAEIKRILLSVKESGNEKERGKAQRYEEVFFGKFISFEAASSYFWKGKSISGEKKTSLESSHSAFASLSAYGLCLFGNDYSLRYAASSYIDYDYFAPHFTRSAEHNYIRGFSVQKNDFAAYFEGETLFCMQKNNFKFRAGLSRMEYSESLSHSLVLSSAAPPFLNAAFSYEGKRFRYTKALGLLGAAKYTGDGKYLPIKLFSFQALEVPLFDSRFVLKFYEGTVWGGHAGLQYFLPLPAFIMSGVGGFEAKTLAGGGFSARFFPYLQLDLDALVDSFKLKRLLKLDAEGAALRGSFLLALSYAPPESYLRKLSVRYEHSRPFTYTSYNTLHDEYNLLDYTNFGMCIGLSDITNFHAVEMEMIFEPMDIFSILVKTRVVRAANAWENATEAERKNAAPFRGDAGSDSLKNRSNFLSAPHIMQLCQCSLGISVRALDYKRTKLSFEAAYMFEYVQNEGVERKIEYEKAWRAALKDVFNNYLRIGIKATF